MSPKMKTNIEALSSAADSMKFARLRGHEKNAGTWEAKYRAILDTMPHGSGLDGETTVEKMTDTELVLRSAIHKMDSDGFYTEWADVKIRISSTFQGIRVRVSGRGIEGYREWLEDTFREWAGSLAEPAPEVPVIRSKNGTDFEQNPS